MSSDFLEPASFTEVPLELNLRPCVGPASRHFVPRRSARANDRRQTLLIERACNVSKYTQTLPPQALPTPYINIRVARKNG